MVIGGDGSRSSVAFMWTKSRTSTIDHIHTLFNVGLAHILKLFSFYDQRGVGWPSYSFVFIEKKSCVLFLDISMRKM